MYMYPLELDACNEAARCPVPLWHRGRISVLVVSERPEDLEPALSQLRAQLFDVVITSRGWDAYYRARAAMPGVMLVDAELGSMDSMTLCRLIQRAGMVPRMGVIVMSRSNTVQTRIACLELGVFDVLSLPLDPKELMLRIAAHRRATLLKCEATAECGIRGPRHTTLSPVVQAVIDLVDRKGGLACGVKQLAKNIGMRERRLTETFKAEMGEPLSTYLRRKKISAACRLLSGTTLSIKEIAVQVGFRSPCNFTVAFQHGMGMSPSRYRDQTSMAAERSDALIA